MTTTPAEIREQLRGMALSLATGTGPLVEPSAFDAALDAYRDALLAEPAVSSAGQAPATNHDLRDRIAQAIEDAPYRPETRRSLQLAAAVLAVLPAPADHDDVAARTLASLEKVTERARRAEAEVKRLRTMYNASEARVSDLIDERDQLLKAPTDPAATLRWAADVLGRMDYDADSTDYGYDSYRDAWNGGVMDAADRLRRLADETRPPMDDAQAAAAIAPLEAAVRRHREQQRTDHHVAVLREAADDLATAFSGPMVTHIGALGASHLRRRAREIEARRLADETPDTQTDTHVCEPDATAYYCPTSGETESDCHGGFTTCCDRPDLHQPAAGARQDGDQS